jgi:tetratricopeptide (TPR) repeat protein
MKTIFADYNAMTEKEHVRLTCQGSREDIQAARLTPGDWAWLSDGEIVVGAKLEADPDDGLVGIPDWETIVHLDDENDRDPNKLAEEFQRLSQNQGRTAEDETRIFQILTLMETFSPPNLLDRVRPGYFAFRRAGALQNMGKLGLACTEIERARQEAPNDPNTNFLYLHLLSKTDLAQAVRKAKLEANMSHAHATVLAACINVLAIESDNVSDAQFRTIATDILNWSERFDQAPTRNTVATSIAASVDFNRGMTLLRLGDYNNARQWLDRAFQSNRSNLEYREATQLSRYDQRARDLASRVHSAIPIAA